MAAKQESHERLKPLQKVKKKPLRMQVLHCRRRRSGSSEWRKVF